MNGRGILKKPKREIESDVEEENNKIDNNICGSNNVVNDDDPETVSTSNYEEQEEALVALIEHRTKEVEHLQNRVSYYQSQLKQTQQRLQDTEAKLVNVRRKICDEKWNKSLPAFRKEVKMEHRPVSPVNQGSTQRHPQSKSQLLISSVSQKSSRPMTLAETGPKASPSHYDSSMKSRGDRSHGTPSGSEDSKSQAVGEKRKLECREHKELVSKVRTTSSPSTIQCHASTHISSQHKRKLRSLTVCPVIDKLFVTSALDGMINLWQIQAKGDLRKSACSWCVTGSSF